MSKDELWKDENEPQNTELPSMILEVPKNFRLQKSALTMLLAAPVEIELHEGNTGMSKGELWKDEVGSVLQKSDF